METPNHASPVLADSPPVSNNTRLRGVHSSLLPYAQQSTPFSPSKHIKIPRRKPVKQDDVRSNGWLDAMKASSPPRKKLVKDFNFEIDSEDSDAAYLSWMVIVFPLQKIHKFKMVRFFFLLGLIRSFFLVIM